MKNYFILFLLLFAFSVSISFAQKFPALDPSPSDISYLRGKDKSAVIKITYGRPQKKGRVIFGELEQFGKVWRTGANEATEIKFYKDVKIDGKSIKAGTYSLFTIPEKDKWTIILNSELDVWGAYSYKKEKDILRAVVKTEIMAAEVEAFSIIFKDTETGADMLMAWDKTLVTLPITVSK